MPIRKHWRHYRGVLRFVGVCSQMGLHARLQKTLGYGWGGNSEKDRRHAGGASGTSFKLCTRPRTEMSPKHNAPNRGGERAVK